MSASLKFKPRLGNLAINLLPRTVLGVGNREYDENTLISNQ